MAAYLDIIILLVVVVLGFQQAEKPARDPSR